VELNGRASHSYITLGEINESISNKNICE
jgi:hypothetical protein